MISNKLKALKKALKTAHSAQHECELRDDIRREEQHLDSCEFITENKRLRAENKRLRAELAQYNTKPVGA